MTPSPTVELLRDIHSLGTAAYDWALTNLVSPGDEPSFDLAYLVFHDYR